MCEKILTEICEKILIKIFGENLTKLGMSKTPAILDLRKISANFDNTEGNKDIEDNEDKNIQTDKEKNIWTDNSVK